MKFRADNQLIDEMSEAIEVILPEVNRLMNMIQFRLQYFGEKGYSYRVASFDILLLQQIVDTVRVIRQTGIEPVLEQRIMLADLIPDGKVVRPLKRKGITTVADVRERWVEISSLDVKHFGPSGFRKLCEALKQHGIEIP